MRLVENGSGPFPKHTFLKAINTGHGGSMTTVHADTAELAIERLAQTALEAPGKMTYRDMISYVTRSIDVIVHMGKESGTRSVNELFLPRNDVAEADPAEHTDREPEEQAARRLGGKARHSPL